MADTRWKAGQSGNPNGRPKSGKAITDILRAEIEKKHKGQPWKVQFVRKIMDLALKGVPWAAQMVYDRIEGKPTDKLELHGVKLDLTREQRDAITQIVAMNKEKDGKGDSANA